MKSFTMYYDHCLVFLLGFGFYSNGISLTALRSWTFTSISPSDLRLVRDGKVSPIATAGDDDRQRHSGLDANSHRAARPPLGVTPTALEAAKCDSGVKVSYSARGRNSSDSFAVSVAPWHARDLCQTL